MGVYATKAIIDIATSGTRETKTIIENRTVIENKEVKVVHINVAKTEDLKHSDDVQLGQRKVFFYPNP